MAAAAAAQQPPQQPQQHPFRVRTITAFLQLAADNSKWEAEVASAGRFLAHAQQHLESLGYEVQTVRIATQPFPAFLAGGSSSSSSSNGSGSTDFQQQQQEQHQQPEQQQTSASLDDIMVTNAVLLESLASQHGIPLVSLGSSSYPQHLTVIPRLVTATKGTSCTFALPAEADWGLAYRVAEVVLSIAGETDGMGNFRFGSASNMQPGIPYFPVACCGPEQHRTFAIGTEADALLHQAFTAAAAMAAAAAGSVAAVAGGQGGVQPNVLQLAEQQLHAVLLQHLSPLQEAALQIEALYQQINGSSSSSGSAACFRYLGLDTSLAPGLDTPPLTDSYQSLLQHLLPACAAAAGAGDTAVQDAAVTAAAAPGAAAAAPGAAAAAIGGPGSLTLSSLITSVLKSLPLRLTGYCGLMLAVCEDQGLAAAAAAGSITISQLLQYSTVCGCGLDTVPVPGPTPTQHQQLLLEEAGVSGQPSGCDVAVAAAAQDAATTAAIAGLVADVNTLAHRLNKPLACRLLPLPGKLSGQPTDFHHPYMINSRVMDLHK